MIHKGRRDAWREHAVERPVWTQLTWGRVSLCKECHATLMWRATITRRLRRSRKYIYAHTYTYVYKHRCMYVHIYIYVCVHMYTHVHIHISIFIYLECYVIERPTGRMAVCVKFFVDHPLRITSAHTHIDIHTRSDLEFVERNLEGVLDHFLRW